MAALLVPGRVSVIANPLVQSSFPTLSTTKPPFPWPLPERSVSSMLFFVVVLLFNLQAVEAHLAAWHKGTWAFVKQFLLC